MNDSPFRHLFGTNYVPSDKQLDAIKYFLASPLQELQKIDEQIECLWVRRQELMSLVNAHQALLSPIRRVSPEILQKIFVEMLPNNGYPAMHASEAPMLLGRVCSRWRQIVYGTAELWRSIHVAIPTPGINAGEDTLVKLRLQAMTEWLDRAGGLPLRLSIYVADPTARILRIGDLKEAHGYISQYAEALLPYASRWGDLHLTFAPYFLKPWKNLRGHQVSSLRSFSIKCEHSMRFEGIGDWESLGFLSSTLLTSVTLAPPAGMPDFRKDVLTDLNISTGLSFSSGADFVRFFSECKMIRSLSFVISETRWSSGNYGINPVVRVQNDSPLDQPVTLPYLEDLRIGGIYSQKCSLIDFWNGFCLPKLRSMEFVIPASTYGYDAFSRFIKRSPCSILCICTGTLEHAKPSLGGNLLGYFEACSSITELTIRHNLINFGPEDEPINVGESVLETIFLANSSPSMRLENLTYLSIGGQCFNTLNNELLDSALHARGERCRAMGQESSILDVVHVQVPSGISDEDRMRWGNRHESGTKLALDAPRRPDEPFHTSAFFGRIHDN
jgi:hypothetical protein